MAKEAIYAGTFDPITLGHIDIIDRALEIVETLHIAVASDSNSNKSPLFNIDERIELVKADIAELPQKNRVIVHRFSGLLVDFANKTGINTLIRGLRAVSDFEYEFTMSVMNRRMNEDINTIFLPASEPTQFISSTLVKQVAKLDGDVSSFVSPNVTLALKNKYNNKS